jgi:hypothetical protein
VKTLFAGITAPNVWITRMRRDVARSALSNASRLSAVRGTGRT